MKKYNKILLFLSCCFIVIGILFYPNYKQQNNKPTITVTTTFLGDAVTNLVGDKVNLNVLMGPGVDPHIYQATPSDLNKIYNSDLVIFQGLKLEGKLAEVLASINQPNINVLEATKNINRDDLIISLQKGDDIEYDPHIWFDPNLWNNVVNTISEEISITFPDLAFDAIKNNVKYQEQINNMGNEVKNIINQIPQEQRILITAHDAFNYLARFTNIQVDAIQGLSIVSEASTNDINRLVNIITTHNIKSIFVESSVSPKLINSLASNLNNQGYDIKIGATLYSDSLGDKNSDASTYIDMYITNATNIRNGLI